MAATIDYTTFRGEDVSGTKRRQMGIYTGPASYVAGGDPFVPADVKMGNVDMLLVEMATNAAATVFYLLRWLKGTQKMIWVDFAGVEVVAGTNLSTFVARFEAIGQ